MDMMTSTQMDDLNAEEKAKKAISHVLKQIRTNPAAAHAMGLGSQSFSLLTEAAAALYDEPLDKLRRHFSSAP